ncbi:MAG: hypothetical protein RBS49_06335 [Sphaerochaeta sp.]|jgi:hypothetical protein|nr:hypothetical protein [Sphaerochaeta sp.]MDX9915494.1 hypothetical protein [Sphaerochaeta sp.]
MQHPDSMMLSLIQPIIYQAPPFVYQSSEDAYQNALTLLDGAQSGCEVIITLTSTGRVLFVGFKDAPSAEELLAIESGEEQPGSEGVYALEAGRYQFIQMAPPETLAPILSLAPIAIDGPARFSVRLLKEGPLSIIAQLWIKR